MSQNNDGFRDDKELLKAINRTQEKMREPEGFDMEKLMEEVIKSSRPILKAQGVFRNMLYLVVELGHEDMGFWKRKKFLHSLKHTLVLWQHVQECDKCKVIFQEFLKQIEAFSCVKIEILNIKKTD